MSEDGQKKFISKLTDALEEGRKKGTEQGFDLAHAETGAQKDYCREGKREPKKGKANSGRNEQ